MTLNEARLIREIKKGCTYRRLAEVYYAEADDGYGNQGYGEDLCKAALELLYPGRNIWQTRGEAENAQFGLQNKSHIGDFFWWE